MKRRRRPDAVIYPMRAVPEPVPMLTMFLEDPEVADEDHERPWGRAFQNAERLGPEFFRNALPRLFGHEEVERTIGAVNAGRDRVTDLFDGRSAKNEFGRGLLEALVASPRNSDKGFLAQWIEYASAGGSLGHLKNLAPTESDLEILREVFPESSRLQDLP